MTQKLKVLIVEDDAIIAQLIEFHLIEFGHHVLDIAHSSERALDLIHNLHPDLVLLDINILGTKDGIEVAEIINKNYNIPFIFLTALSDKNTLDRAKDVRPSAYIVKPFKGSDLETSISIGMSNYEMRRKKKEITLENVNAVARSKLSQKEYEVLNEISKGLTNQQIGINQNMSSNTVKWHTQNIYSKLGVKNRTSAVQLILNLKAT